MIKLAIIGMQGRMGSEVRIMAQQDLDFEVIYGFEKMGYQGVIQKIPFGYDESNIARADVIIDFSVPEVSHSYAHTIVSAKKPYVIGTTGFNVDQEKLIRKYAEIIPIVKSPNMSLGMNLMYKLAQLSTQTLRPRDIEMEETHHIHKKDKPSGSALKIKGYIVQADQRWEKINIVSHRKGEVVGEHMVKLIGWEEELILVHNAKSRKPFAAGALIAAKWVVQQKKPGLYDMQDVLGLKT